MVVFPNCKVNLGLHILGKRQDGFHNLETFFYPVKIYDALEIVAASNNETTCITSGESIQVNAENNICIKAYNLLRTDFSQLPAVTIHLHKIIPIGAGLGGGSSDGAHTLSLLNKKFSLGLSTKDLLRYASLLGSDCPFFILNTPCFAKGRGEILEPVSLDLSSLTIVVVNPGIHINTGWAFSQLELQPKTRPLKEVIEKPIQEWRSELTNDFETSVFKAYPEIETVKKELYNAGAIYASLSGSGSTVYGIFERGIAPSLAFPPHYFVKILR